MSSNCKKVTNWLLFDSDHDEFRKLKKIKKLPFKKNSSEKQVDDVELTKSPISGTYIIKDWINDKSTPSFFSRSEVELNSLAASFVEITPQSRAKIAKIPNKIGAYECRLCRVVYEDAFELAMHNCPRVVHIEYKCSECEKSFNCPANLASHKRWHKPKISKQKLIKPKLDEKKKPIQTEIKNNNSELNFMLPTTSQSSSWQNYVHEQYFGMFSNSNSNFSNNNNWLSHIYSSYLNAAAVAAASVNGIYTPIKSDNLPFQLSFENKNLNFNFDP